MFTKEQEVFLAKFADEQIAAAQAETDRITQSESDRIKAEIKEAAIAEIIATKEAEKQAAIEALDKV